MFVRVAASLILPALVGCAEKAQKDEAAKASPSARTKTVTDTEVDTEDTETETETETGTATAAGGGGDADFGVSPFLYGPYLSQAFSGGGGATYTVEFGYLDIRRQKGLGSGANDIFDFRWKTVAATAGDNPLPSKASSGCGAVEGKTFDAAADAVEISGATAAELEAGERNVYLFENVEQGAEGFDPSKGLVAAFRSDASEVARVTADAPPAIGSVRLSGAYDATLNINLGARFLSDALKVASDALKLGDEGGGAYDLAVVTLMGGKAAKTAAIRCYIAPGGSVELSEESYKSLLPLRGFYTIYAKITAATAGGATTWAASIVGDGAYDETVD